MIETENKLNNVFLLPQTKLERCWEQKLIWRKMREGNGKGNQNNSVVQSWTLWTFSQKINETHMELCAMQRTSFSESINCGENPVPPTQVQKAEHYNNQKEGRRSYGLPFPWFDEYCSAVYLWLHVWFAFSLSSFHVEILYNSVQ